ncbi:MAG: hypothetical protein WA771_07030 [Chthoniobacterales bacterium]
MTRTIILSGTEFQAFDWEEAPANVEESARSERHTRNAELLSSDISQLGPGEATFTCDHTFAFDTPFELKGDGRQFVVISTSEHRHVAKPF